MLFWHAEDPSAQLLSVQIMVDPIGFPTQAHGGRGEAVHVQRWCQHLEMPMGSAAL